MVRISGVADTISRLRLRLSGVARVDFRGLILGIACTDFRTHGIFGEVREHISGSYGYGFPGLGRISGRTGTGFRGCTHILSGIHGKLHGVTGADFRGHGYAFQENGEQNACMFEISRLKTDSRSSISP